MQDEKIISAYRILAQDGACMGIDCIECPGWEENRCMWRTEEDTVQGKSKEVVELANHYLDKVYNKPTSVIALDSLAYWNKKVEVCEEIAKENGFAHYTFTEIMRHWPAGMISLLVKASGKPFPYTIKL